MLDRITIAARIGLGFGIVIALLLLLAVTAVQGTRTLEANFSAHREGVTIRAEATQMQLSLTAVRRALEAFSAAPSPEAALQIDMAETGLAAALARLGAAGAAGADAETAPIAEAVSAFGAAARAYRTAALDAATDREEVTRLGIEYRRAIGRINATLEAREAGDLAYDALRASEAFLVTRVRIDRFLDGWPVEEFATASPPLEETLAALDRLGRRSLLPEERSAVAAARAGVTDFRAVAERARDSELARREARAAIAAAAPVVIASVEQAIAATDAAYDLLEAAAERQFARSQMLAATIAAIALLAALLIALVIGRSVRRATAGVAATIERLASGDLDRPVPGAGLRTEIGAMARALEVLREHGLENRRAAAAREEAAAAEEARKAEEAASQARVVAEVNASLERLAAGDLASPIESPHHDPFPAEYEAVRTTFNRAIDRLSDVMSRIREVAGGVRGGAAEISAAATELSGRAETQAATLEESAAALNELTESVRSTAARAEAAERASQENRSVAEEGTRIVRDAVEAMAGIERSSAQITRIIGVIDDIAFQTNLLALNAGVEAARAGEAGRGFAVVASEVRGLAQRATESAREIKALIHESASQVETGSALVGRTGASLGDILAKAGEVSSLMAEIATAASEQAAGLDEINSGVNHLDQVTQQNAAVAEETTAAAASLTAKAEDLSTALVGFRTRDLAGGPEGSVLPAGTALPLDPQIATVLSWPGGAGAPGASGSASGPAPAPGPRPPRRSEAPLPATGTDWSEF